jgi:hypothetical protein
MEQSPEIPRAMMIALIIKLYPKAVQHLKEFAYMTDQQVSEEFDRINSSYLYLISEKPKVDQCIKFNSGLEAIEFNSSNKYTHAESTKAEQYCINREIPWNQ